MISKLVLVSQITVVTLCLVAAIVLPLYFLKWKEETSKPSDIGAIMAGAGVLDTVIQLKLSDCTYYSLFTNAPPFETDANGVFARADADFRLTTVGGVFTGQRRLFEITNCMSNPAYNPECEVFNPLLFFDKTIAVATESQIINKGCNYTSNTNSTQGGFYLSDDGRSIKAGCIKTDMDGTRRFEKLTNIAPTSELSQIPNNWFVIGSPSLSVSQYVYSAPGFNHSFAGPFVWPLKNVLVNTTSTKFATTTLNMFSDVYFLIRVPLSFTQYLFSTEDDIAGISTWKVSFTLDRLMKTNAVNPGWSIVSAAEFSTVITSTTNLSTSYGFPMVCLLNDSLVQYYQLMTTAGVAQLVPRSMGIGYFDGNQTFWIVKSDTRKTSIPLASDILDLSVVIGSVASLAAVPQVATIAISTSKTGETTIVNQETGISVTQTTADGQVTTTNLNTGQVTINRTGDVPNAAALTAVPAAPKKQSFYEKNKLYIYEAVGVTTVLLVFSTAAILLWKYNRQAKK